MVQLGAKEVIEDLQLCGLRMIQSSEGFKFGEDSVLLANYVAGICSVSRKAGGIFYDLGCNSGIISLLIAAKLPRCKVTGVEIVRQAYELCIKNIQINGLGERISCMNSDWNDIGISGNAASADFVISNPPYAYRTDNAADISDEKRVAREEIFSDARGLACATAFLLKPGGMAFYIYRANRLTDVLTALRDYRLEPVRIRFVHPYTGKAPNAFIVTARKHGRPSGLVIEKPLVIFDRPGVYTGEVQAMYGKCSPMGRQELYRDITDGEMAIG
ncbi:MAG: tRNA1(Val) (adenine(37)-N6)-methyltransferase [Saccharofermentanales bacterium]